MPKPTDRYFRSDIIRGLAGGVDKKSHIIRGFSVISKGEAKGHGLEIDDTTLNLVAQHGNAKEGGIKSRFGHPNMSNSAIGTYLGRAKNFKVDGDRVRADLHISDVAFESPKGDLGTYVEKLAESEPDMFGSSIVFPINDRVKNEGETGIKDSEGDFMDLARPSVLSGVDVVDDPATEDGMFSFFSTTVKPSAEMTEFLNTFLKLPDAMDRIHSFLNRYVENKEQKQKLIALAERMTIMPDENKDTKDNKPKQFMFQLVEGDIDMPEEKKETTLTEAVVKEREELRAKGERERILTIQKLGKKFNISDEIIQEYIDSNDSLESVALKLGEIDLKKNSKEVDSTKVIPDIHIDKEARDKKLEIMTNTFLVKGGVIDDPKIREEVASSEFRGMGMRSCVSHFLSEAGVKDVHMLSGDGLYSEIIKQCQRTQFGGAMAQGTGDFVNLLSGTMNKSMAKGWADAPVTYPLWCGSGNLSDFKTADIIKMSAYGDVELIPEGEAPRQSKMADTKETAKLATYGSYYTLSRQAIVNDDLNWFTRIPQRMASSYRRTINYRVYWYLFNANVTPLTTTPWVGPTMTEDTTALFNLATHRNYLAIGSGAAVSEATLTYGWEQMLTQTQASPDNLRSNVVYSPTSPKYLIHGPHQTVPTHKLLNSTFYSTDAGDPNDDYQISNIYGPGKPRNLIPVEEVLLDYWVTSTATYPWYLAADPSIIDTITVYGLNGETRPSTSSEPSSIGEAMGMKYQVVGDFGIAAIDWRGLFLNTGR